MRGLLRLHTAIVGRIPSQGTCQTFGGLLLRRNRHFARGNAGGSDNKQHKADLVLDASFEPTTYPDGCDKDAYRSYFKRSKVHVLGDPLEGRTETITKMIRGLRPDAVVMMPLAADATELMDSSPEKAKQKFSKEILVAYKEAKALPHCTVVSDNLSLGLSPLDKFKVAIPPKKVDADIQKRMDDLSEKMEGKLSDHEKKELRSQAQRLIFEANPHMRELKLDQELYGTYLLQRTLHERASEKYTRLQASEKDKLEPVRIVALTEFNALDRIEENWQRPIEKERIDELLKKERPTGGGLVFAIPMRAVRIVAGIVLLVGIGTILFLLKLVWDLAFTLLRKKHLSDD